MALISIGKASFSDPSGTWSTVTVIAFFTVTGIYIVVRVIPLYTSYWYGTVIIIFGRAINSHDIRVT